jgi:two-component system, OmpR family, phosphate regulon response regulator OmpR
MPKPKDDQHHILVVDDDKRIRELLVSYLVGNGYRVTAAANALEARKAMTGLAYDVIVLDVMMPGENGLDFASGLRASSNGVPILMLSARSDAADRIKGLAQGSDDYLGKPFEPEELLLRLRNLTKRSVPSKSAARVVRFGDCVFDMETGELLRADERVHVTGREREILRILIKADGQPVARATFQPQGSDEAARAIDVQVNRLRQKIEKDPALPLYLQTVRGEGYCLITEGV